MQLKSKEELSQLLRSQNIRTFAELFQGFNISFKRNEYAMHTTFTYDGEKFKQVTNWYTLTEDVQEISRERFIEALTRIVQDDNFTIWLKDRKEVIAEQRLEEIKAGKEYYLSPATKIEYWNRSKKFALSKDKMKHGLRKSAVKWQSEELTPEQVKQLLLARIA